MSEINRKLATVERIVSLEKHPNADTLDLIGVRGWTVISKSDQHKINDLVVYFEIDSFLPVDDRYEFLRKGGFKSTKNLGDGFRLRTMKLRGEVSSGLILPLEECFEVKREDGKIYININTSELLNSGDNYAGLQNN